MANTKSAIKRIRRIATQTLVNKARRSKYRNAIKKMNIIIEEKKKDDALKFLPKLNSELMKVAKTGIIKKGGSSIRDFKNTSGKNGNFQKEFKVYQRENLDCLRSNCSGKIKKIFISNRSTFFCNICQK